MRDKYESKSSKKLIRPLSKAFALLLDEFLEEQKKEKPSGKEHIGHSQRRLNQLIAHLLLPRKAVPEENCASKSSSEYDGSAKAFSRHCSILVEAGVSPGQELLIAQAYEDALHHQRFSGSYYTPPALAKELTDIGLKHLSAKKTFRLADPACGTGIFLLTALDYIKENSLEKERPGKSIEILGVEHHGPTAQMAQILTTSRSQKLGLDNIVTVTIREGDALIDIDWSHHFDAVIGNPPFLSETRGQADRFVRYRDKSIVGNLYCHKMDLFYFFLGLAIEILRPGGRLALVVADYWTSRASAEPLRRLLLQKMQIAEYVALGDHRLFRNAIGCHSALLTAEKKATSEGSAVTSVQTFRLCRYAGAGGAHSFQSGQGCAIGNSKSLSFLFAEEVRLLSLLQERSNHELVQSAYVQGLVAPQTRLGMPRRGRRNFDDGEGIFVLTNEELEALQLSKKEMSLIRPYYWGTQVLHYHLQGPPGGNLFYIDCKSRKEVLRNAQAYASVRAHFDRYAEHITSAFAPYGLHRARDESCFVGHRRLIGVRKGLYPRLCLVEAEVEAFVGETCFVILPGDKAEEKTLIPFLLLLLNSTLAHFWFTHAKAQGRHVQLDKGPLLSIPLRIPRADVYEALIASVEETLQQGEAEVPLRAYDAIVYALYGLEPWAIELIERATDDGRRGGEIEKLPSLDEALGQVGLSHLPSSLLFSK